MNYFKYIWSTFVQHLTNRSFWSDRWGDRGRDGNETVWESQEPQMEQVTDWGARANI